MFRGGIGNDPAGETASGYGAGIPRRVVRMKR